MEIDVTNIEVIVEGEGLLDIETIQLQEGSTGRQIVAAVALKGGFPVEEGFLFLEDIEAPIDLTIVIEEASVGGRVHHVHRVRRIEVAVFYQGRHIDKAFPPSARIQRVLDWAVGFDGFKIDPMIAPEMELALHGQTTALPKSAHIGRYIKHPHHELSFDLIRGVVPNGTCQ